MDHSPSRLAPATASNWWNKLQTLPHGLNFLILLLLLLLLDTRYLTIGLWDNTLFTAFYFHPYYEEILTHNQIPLWFPYFAYGGTAEAGFILTGSVEWFTILIGKLLNISNSLLLFRLSFVLRDGVFLFGMYLLSVFLFRRRSTVNLVCISTLCILTPLVRIHSVAFYIITWFPLTLLFLLLFFRQRRPEYLWLTGIVGVISCFGLIYFIVLYVVVILTIFAVLLYYHRDIWRCVPARTWSNLATFLVFIFLAGGFVYLHLSTLRGVTFLRSDRDVVTGLPTFTSVVQTSKGVILPNVIHSLVGVIPEKISFKEQTTAAFNILYVGFLPLVLFGVALLKERIPIFKSLFWAGFVFVWIGLLGFFTLAFYSCFPFFATMRWYFLLSNVLLCIIALGAGFGWEHFLGMSVGEKVKAGAVSLIGIAFAVDMSNLFFGWSPTPDLLAISTQTVWFKSLAVRLAVYGVCIFLALILAALLNKNKDQPLFPFVETLLIIGLVFDLLSFQNTLMKISIPSLQEIQKESLPASEVVYREQRIWQDGNNPRYKNLEATYKHFVAQGITYEYTHFDPCAPRSNLNLINANLYRLSQVWDAQAAIFSLKYSPKADGSDRALLQILGCETPKIRLVTQARYAENDEQAVQLMRDTADIYDTAIIQLPQGMSEPARAAANGANGVVQVIDFTRNQLDVQADVTNPGGAWLVYADAFHEGWHAWVDGKEVPLARAYLALKAVWLPQGKHTLKFAFWNGLHSLCIYIYAVVQIICCLIVFLWMGAYIIGKERVLLQKLPFYKPLN